MSTHPMDYAPYQRLARAYPAGRRRDELLDTMIMAAEDGARARPTTRETLDVLRHAPRAWLGRPGSRCVVLAAVMVSLLTGLVGGCLAARVTASAQYRPLPSPAAVTELGALVTPETPLSATDRYDRPVVALSGDTRYGYALLSTAHDFSTHDIHPFTEGVVARLRQAGWQTNWLIEPVPSGLDGQELVVATKAGVVLRVSTARWEDGPLNGDITITVQRAPSVWLFVAGGLGAGLGLILGWLLTGWASRRTEEHQAAGVALGVLTAFAAVTMAQPAWYTIQRYVAALSGDLSYTDSPFWGWTEPGNELSLFTAPAVLAVIGAAVVTAAGRPQPTRSGTPATGARSLSKVVGAIVLAAALAALLGVYVASFSAQLRYDRMTLLIVGVTAVTLLQVLVVSRRRPSTTESQLRT